MTLTTPHDRFIAGLSPDRLPGKAVRIALAHLINSIATMIAGHFEGGVGFSTEAAGDGIATAILDVVDYEDHARDRTTQL